MTSNPPIHNRKSIRLHGYDYSQFGGYYVTICTREKDYVFGEVKEEGVRLSAIGKITKRCWEEIPKHFIAVELDDFIVMPDHVHGIIILNKHDDVGKPCMDVQTCRDVQLNVPTTPPIESNIGARISPRRGSLSVIIRTFKAAVTTECLHKGYHEFGWQPRFYDHIIRDGEDLDRIRKYINENPTKWLLDKNNPDEPS